LPPERRPTVGTWVLASQLTTSKTSLGTLGMTVVLPKGWGG
jgi:hypothetical protein